MTSATEIGIALDSALVINPRDLGITATGPGVGKTVRPVLPTESPQHLAIRAQPGWGDNRHATHSSPQ